jgi:hypothetical protein
MNHQYHINFGKEVGPDQIGDLLLNSLTAVEAVAGKEALRREAFFNMNEELPRVELTVKGPAGAALLRCLQAFLARDFEPEQYTVHRLKDQRQQEPQVLVAFAIAVI